MTADSKALPEFERNGRRFLVTAFRGDDWASADVMRPADYVDLSAVLAAMAPERREALMSAVARDALMQRDVFCEKLNEYIDKTKDAEKALTDERAKVVELQRNAAALCEVLGFHVPANKTAFEWLDERVRSLKRNADWETQEHARHHRVEEDLRATLATVQAERDGMRAFFEEHGSTCLGPLYTTAQECRRSASSWGEEAIVSAENHEAAAKAISALLATLPKGTKET